MRYSGVAPVSVLMSTYFKDSPAHLERSMQSIYEQTIRPSEIVLVVDGEISAESTTKIELFEKRDIPLKIVRCAENRGLAKALNAGLRHCSYEMVVRMDADDINLPDRIEKNLFTLDRNPDSAIVGGAYIIYSEDMSIVIGERTVPATYEEVKRYSKFRVPFNHPTILFKKSAIISIGGYPEDIGRFEDWGLSLKCLAHGLKITNTTDPILKFRGGAELMHRRVGLNYLVEEINALRRMHQSGIMSRFDLFANILLRAPMRLLPKSVLGFIYRSFMHRRTHETYPSFPGMRTEGVVASELHAEVNRKLLRDLDEAISEKGAVTSSAKRKVV